MFTAKEVSAFESVCLAYYLKGVTVHKRTWWQKLFRLPARITFEGDIPPQPACSGKARHVQWRHK